MQRQEEEQSRYIRLLATVCITSSRFIGTVRCSCHQLVSFGTLATYEMMLCLFGLHGTFCVHALSVRPISAMEQSVLLVHAACVF